MKQSVGVEEMRKRIMNQLDILDDEIKNSVSKPQIKILETKKSGVYLVLHELNEEANE